MLKEKIPYFLCRDWGCRFFLTIHVRSNFLSEYMVAANYAFEMNYTIFYTIKELTWNTVHIVVFCVVARVVVS